VGSCTQISLFVTPLVVIVGWITDRPMTLNFPPFEIVLFILSVIVVSILLSYPNSNWLEGSMLITTYVMIAVGFWFERVTPYDEEQ
jgi:Ca2+:H+ antiporter